MANDTGEEVNLGPLPQGFQVYRAKECDRGEKMHDDIFSRVKD